jgi:hypothetical protein
MKNVHKKIFTYVYFDYYFVKCNVKKVPYKLLIKIIKNLIRKFNVIIKVM